MTQSDFVPASSTVPVVRQDVDAAQSSKKGLAGVLETILRRFRIFAYMFTLTPLYFLGALCMGIALVPGIYLFGFVRAATQHWPEFWRFLALGVTIASSYFLYGFTLLFLIPLVNFLLCLKIRPWRGIYYSLPAVPWYIHNALTYLVRFTFLKFVTPTPWNIFFYRGMGMKVGRNVMINTTYISDPCLIELGDKVTIGGSVTMVAHYGVGGYLVIAPVKIGKGAVIGLKATIMGDVEIGENAKVLPNSVVMPKTRIPAGELWGGVPAQCIRSQAKESES